MSSSTPQAWRDSRLPLPQHWFPGTSQGGILETLEGDLREDVSEGTHAGRLGLQEGPQRPPMEAMCAGGKELRRREQLSQDRSLASSFVPLSRHLGFSSAFVPIRPNPPIWKMRLGCISQLCHLSQAPVCPHPVCPFVLNSLHSIGAKTRKLKEEGGEKTVNGLRDIFTLVLS